MREIKFRAWDTVNKKMITSPMAICSGEGGWVIFTAECEGMDCSNAIHPIQQYELMQYTGLLDCKGKEIYEDDIVSYEYENVTGWHKQKRVVIWNDKAAAFEVPVANPWTRNIKVIGNMYEHPELVKHDTQP